jgi:hypothetical protein
MPAFELMLKEQGHVSAPDRVIVDRASKADVEHAHVFALGNLPLHLAVLAEKVTVFPLRAAKHGDQLGVEQLRAQTGSPKTYRVEFVP